MHLYRGFLHCRCELGRRGERQPHPTYKVEQIRNVSAERYIPALGYGWLARLYDPVVRATTREGSFKRKLVEQSGVIDEFQVLDLACGTGTMAILLKLASPGAAITGIDGDPGILELAKEKAFRACVEIRFDEGMSFCLPYPAGTFHRVISSLFFHHLTRETKLKTLSEVKRVLKPHGELHIADWGLPANPLMKFASGFVQMLDGFETTADNFDGLLPELISDAGFEDIEETSSFNTLFGTIRLHKALKNKQENQ